MSRQQNDFKQNRIEERKSRLAAATIPRGSNEPLIDGLSDLPDVVKAAKRNLNNWVEFLDVRLRNDGKVGIPCRYRWGMKRWAENDMDAWLMDHGWTHEAHLFADSRQHKSNELEARYKQEFEGYMVYVNIFVPISERTFEEINPDSAVESAQESRKQEERRNSVLMAKRLR